MIGKLPWPTFGDNILLINDSGTEAKSNAALTSSSNDIGAGGFLLLSFLSLIYYAHLFVFDRDKN